MKQDTEAAVREFSLCSRRQRTWASHWPVQISHPCWLLQQFRAVPLLFQLCHSHSSCLTATQSLSMLVSIQELSWHRWWLC